jgi:hypothetical protein
MNDNAALSSAEINASRTLVGSTLIDERGDAADCNNWSRIGAAKAGAMAPRTMMKDESCTITISLKFL